MKKQLGANERLYPMPCPVVVGGTMERADALTVAWINVVASTPPTIAMGLRRTRHTLELIRETGDFTVNLPMASQAPIVDYFGLYSGRDHDKFAESGWTLEPATLVSAPLIAECPYHLECRVTQEVEIGEYVLVLAEIVETHAEESVLDETGLKVDIEKLDPLVYIAGSREYRALGAKVADAFSAGKTLADGRESDSGPISPAS